LAGAKHEDRQPLIQEFFFHLVGAIDRLMQAVNESRKLGILASQVTSRKVYNKLGQTDPIRPLVVSLHPETQHNGKWLPLPQNPYSDEGSHFRILVFRHWVNHCGANPFFLRLGSEPPISLFLDPRNPSIGGSKLSAVAELEAFWKLVNDKCQLVINTL